ncbi:hypothetical protein TURU_012521 [Turdus rufiventris]|nr:hypothetical protein TURU_012521 [Turdus rufiventris]
MDMREVFLQLWEEVARLQELCSEQGRLLQRLRARKGPLLDIPVSLPVQCTEDVLTGDGQSSPESRHKHPAAPTSSASRLEGSACPVEPPQATKKLPPSPGSRVGTAGAAAFGSTEGEEGDEPAWTSPWILPVPWEGGRAPHSPRELQPPNPGAGGSFPELLDLFQVPEALEREDARRDEALVEIRGPVKRHDEEAVIDQGRTSNVVNIHYEKEELEDTPSQRVQFILGTEEDEQHVPHDLFTELDEICVKEGEDAEWKETARWLKFEEDVEDGGERWSKPYVATLSLHSLFELRSCIINGTVLLDVRAASIEDIAEAKNGVTPETSAMDLSKAELHFMKKIPSGAEASNVLVGELDFLQQPLVAFVRLTPAVLLSGMTEVPIPTRFLFVLLGPGGKAHQYHEIGRSMATTMTDEVFHDVAYKAKDRADLVAGIDEFLDQVTVLPPGEWDPSIRIEPPKNVPSQEKRKMPGALDESSSHSKPEKHSGPELERTGRLFGGLVLDVKRKAPWFWSDFRDGLSLQCLASFLFLYCACMSPVITFGGLLGEATHGHISAMESLLGASMTGVVYSLFAGQPLTILGSTGPVLVFEKILYKFCNLKDLETSITTCNLPMSWFGGQECRSLHGEFHGPACGHNGPYAPNVLFWCCILFFSTFVLSSLLKKFKTSRYFPTRVRSTVSDFAVFLTIVIMVLIDLAIGIPSPKLHVPHMFKPTRDDRGWLINPIGPNPWWTVLAALIPALLCTILIFMDQQITAVIVNRKEHRLKKGCGYHLDLFMVAVMLGVCSVMGLPWFVAATVLSITHVNSLKVESDCSAPGEQPKFLGIREQRVTGLMIFVLMGCSVFFTSVLKFFDRLKLFWMPAKHQPDFIYLRHVPLRKVHLFTLIQLLCLVLLWAIKASRAAIIFPMMVLALVFVRKVMDFCFSKRELSFLDDLMPESKKKKLDDAKNEAKEEEESQKMMEAAAANSVQLKLGKTSRVDTPKPSSDRADPSEINISDEMSKTTVWKALTMNTETL